jgi:hypothetical protein
MAPTSGHRTSSSHLSPLSTLLASDRHDWKCDAANSWHGHTGFSFTRGAAKLDLGSDFDRPKRQFRFEFVGKRLPGRFDSNPDSKPPTSRCLISLELRQTDRGFS